MHFIHDLVLILVGCFIFGWIFSLFGLPGKPALRSMLKRLTPVVIFYPHMVYYSFLWLHFSWQPGRTFRIRSHTRVDTDRDISTTGCDFHRLRPWTRILS